MATLDVAIAKIERLSDPNYLADKCSEVTEKLAKIGEIEASKRFYAAPYDDGQSDNDTLVYVEGDGAKRAVVAEGNAVTFIEFGAGVHYNGTEPYPISRPEGIVPIGQYGEGRGKQDGWYFKGADGEKHYTHGTPASMPMYLAAKAIKKSVAEVVAEVFKD